MLMSVLHPERAEQLVHLGGVGALAVRAAQIGQRETAARGRAHIHLFVCGGVAKAFWGKMMKNSVNFNFLYFFIEPKNT